MRYLLFILLSVSVVHTTLCQSQADSILISKIKIEGLQRTKEHIVLREVEFKENESISIADTTKIFELTRNKIFNTNLFIKVGLQYKDETVTITVSERWYIFPFPIIELADRNFNEWWQQRGHKLDRLELGIRFYHNNMRGRNEKLKVVLQRGFTPKYEVFYTIPYINRALKTGVKFSLSYSQNKQVAYATVAHKLDYIESDEYIRKRFYTGLSFIKRSIFYTTHQLDFLFRSNSIGDTIISRNPEYFLDGKRRQKYLEVGYTFDFDKRDIQYYPLSGYRVLLEAKKLGLGIYNDINLWQTFGLFSIHDGIGENFFIGSLVKFKFSSSKTQPFSNFRALGYNENFVRGYELLPIDGQHYFLTRNSIKKRIFNKEFNLKLPFTHFDKAPFSTYFKLFVDYGYVGDMTLPFQNGRYANTNLVGFGGGLDFVTYYDLVFRIEYAVTRHNFSGLFLHFEAAL